LNLSTLVAKPDTAEVMIEVLERLDDEVEGAIETLEIMSDRPTLKAIEKGLQDIKAGNVVSCEDFLKKHGY